MSLKLAFCRLKWPIEPSWELPVGTNELPSPLPILRIDEGATLKTVEIHAIDQILLTLASGDLALVSLREQLS